jgi:uncharacterized protein
MKLSAETRLERLRLWFRALPNVAVAYSGGVDSSLVLKVAVQELGDQAVAMLAVSESLPQSERQEAEQQAVTMGARLELLTTQETADPRYQANAPNRCYFCKAHVYEALQARAMELGLGTVVDGMNADDTSDLRPGRAAAQERGVRSPLCELGFAKADVRAAAQALGLSSWDKPAAACLASRIPYGTPVTPQLLSQVERAEAALKGLGFPECRVRHHGDVARVEVPAAEFGALLTQRDEVVQAMQGSGFIYVTLDLAGLRSGSANEVLKGRAS